MELTVIQKIAIWALPVLFAITGHEVAHGYVASKFGDQTARLAGRLTLNPLKHIDLVGTILVPVMMLMVSNFIFGWAKPVPVDARNLRHPRRDMALVSLAGPISNILMAILWAGVMKTGQYLNPWIGVPLEFMGDAGIWINLILAVLNCLPIPPLDGGRFLYNVLPPKTAWKLYKLEPYGLIILILLMFSGLLTYVLIPPVLMLRSGILLLFGLS